MKVSIIEFFQDRRIRVYGGCQQIQERKGETRYRVRHRALNKDGKLRQTDIRGFKTKREAEAHANTVEVKKMTGDYVSPSLGKITIAELGPDWLERQKGHMRPSSYRSYESCWRNHVKPKWEDTRIADVKFSKCRRGLAIWRPRNPRRWSITVTRFWRESWTTRHGIE